MLTLVWMGRLGRFKGGTKFPSPALLPLLESVSGLVVGKIRKGCHTHGRRFCFRCVAFTLGFPVEHVLWEKTPYISLIPTILGIH